MAAVTPPTHSGTNPVAADAQRTRSLRGARGAPRHAAAKHSARFAEVHIDTVDFTGDLVRGSRPDGHTGLERSFDQNKGQSERHQSERRQPNRFLRRGKAMEMRWGPAGRVDEVRPSSGQSLVSPTG